MRTDVQTQAADRNALFLLHLPEIPVAGNSIKPRLPGLISIKNPSRESILRADIHTSSTITAPRFYGTACWLERGIGQDTDPTHARSVIRGDE